MSVGARWAWEVLDGTARILAVIAILAVSVGGVLLRQPAAVIGGFLGILTIFSFAEGAYRVSREKQQQASSGDVNAIWLSGQLAEGNNLFERWGEHVSRDRETEVLSEAAKWERGTREGLAERLPEYAGHFGVEVGLGREFAWFRTELRERTTLRRRIHRLAEIAERCELRRGI